MGHGTDGLTFNTLRSANLARVVQFKNARGEYSHPLTLGLDNWTPADWITAVVGELGELANILKKVKRGDFALAEKRQEIADELADTQIYLDLLAASLSVDLGLATMEKFNRVSRRIESGVMIRTDGSDWRWDESVGGKMLPRD